MGAYGGTPLASMSPYYTVDVGKVYNPTPADDANNVPVNSELNWKSTSAASAFEIYFGTEEQPQFVQKQNEIFFDPGPLEPNTQYFWRVDSLDNMLNRTTGNIWTFTTGDEFTGKVYNLKIQGSNQYMVGMDAAIVRDY